MRRGAYGAASEHGYGSSRGWKPTQYLAEGGEWDAEKSMQLAELAKMDPTMGEQIAAYTNEFSAQGADVGGRARFAGNRKDLYSMAQDKYLQKMASYLNGVRGAHQSLKV